MLSVRFGTDTNFVALLFWRPGQTGSTVLLSEASEGPNTMRATTREMRQISDTTVLVKTVFWTTIQF